MEDKAQLPSSSRQSYVTAQNSAVANAPQITGCNIQGSVNMNIETHIHAAANTSQTHERSSAEASKVVCSLSKKVSEKLKSSLKQKFQNMYEVNSKRGNPTLLRNVYTELYIMEGEREGLNMEHEIWQIDKVFNVQPEQDHQINCNNIFKPLSVKSEKAERTPPRTVLTKGIAGIGKTVTVQKFILDWAEGEANQDIDLLLVLPFRELNSIKDEKQSLHELLVNFHSELQEFGNTKYCEDCKILLIFDGLDESRLLLDFEQRRISSVSKAASLDDLMTNLFAGNLLPSALLWITSRPAAVDKIPQQLIHRMTEIRGFTNSQKEEYFRKRIVDQSLADRVISHVKESRSLEIMCHIPIFCWITATVLEHMLRESNAKISLSLTEMYTRFLLFQTNEKKKKYLGEARSDPRMPSNEDVQVILNLSRLAFKKLLKSVIVFSEDDLREYSLDVTEASLWSGVFTEIIKEEDPMFSQKKYSFVHLSFQEYLAAFFVFYTYAVQKENVLQPSKVTRPSTYYFDDDFPSESEEDYDEFDLPKEQAASLFDVHTCAVNQALNSDSGHLDLFLRFLLGLSMTTTLKLLKNVVVIEESEKKFVERTIQYLKGKLKEEDDRKTPSSERCINLFLCLLELNDQSMAKEIRWFLRPGRRAEYKLTAAQCSTLAYIIVMSGEVLEELDLKKYNTSEEGRRRLVPAARNCTKALMSDCRLNQRCCEELASALQDPEARLRELDLSRHGLFDRSLTSLLPGLNSPHCRLDVLDLSHINLEKIGALVLGAVLTGPHPQPHTLRLFSCHFRDDCAEILASALWSADCRLRELDISYNDMSCAGVQRVLQGLLSPSCDLQILRLSGSKMSADSCQLLASVLSDAVLTQLLLDNSSIGDVGVKRLCSGLFSPHCQLQTLGLRSCQLSRKACFYLAMALSTYSVLKHLDLGDNDVQDAGVEFLSTGLKNPNCLLQRLGLSGCMVTEEGCSALASALSSNRSHLRELDLTYNHPSDSGVKLLTASVDDPQCSLKTLRLEHGGPSRLMAGLRKYYKEITMENTNDHLRFSRDNKAAIRPPEFDCPDFGSQEDMSNPKWAEQYCREGLELERFYWELEWSGFVSIGGRCRGHFLGRFLSKTLSLICHKQQCFAIHEDQGRNVSLAKVPVPEQRVGVFLDWHAGTLSFFSISPQGVASHIYTFHTEFDKPLFPLFSFAAPDIRDELGSIVVVTPDPVAVLRSKRELVEQVKDTVDFINMAWSRMPSLYKPFYILYQMPVNEAGALELYFREKTIHDGKLMDFTHLLH